MKWDSREQEYYVNLERAIEIALHAHRGALDKGGRPYILHPLAVMHALETDAEKIVGVLHDVVEDSEWTFERLADEGFSEEIIEALRSVTKSPQDTDYFAFIRRVKENPIGRKVKIADIEHNLDLKRISDVTEDDLLRQSKYKKALDLIINDGADLRQSRDSDKILV